MDTSAVLVVTTACATIGTAVLGVSAARKSAKQAGRSSWRASWSGLREGEVWGRALTFIAAGGSFAASLANAF